MVSGCFHNVAVEGLIEVRLWQNMPYNRGLGSSTLSWAELLLSSSFNTVVMLAKVASFASTLTAAICCGIFN